VERVRGGDGHHLDVRFGEHLAVVREPAREAVAARELLGIAGVGEATATTSASSGMRRNDSAWMSA
jgi:hypothetical protein